MRIKCFVYKILKNKNIWDQKIENMKDRWILTCLINNVYIDLNLSFGLMLAKFENKTNVNSH